MSIDEWNAITKGLVVELQEGKPVCYATEVYGCYDVLTGHILMASTGQAFLHELIHPLELYRKQLDTWEHPKWEELGYYDLNDTYYWAVDKSRPGDVAGPK